MVGEARTEFHRELERLDISVGGLLGLIPEAIVSATTGLLTADDTAVERFARWRVLVDDLYGEVESTIEVVVARQAPVAGDLRFLLTCVRLIPVLHETIDLVADIAGPGPRLGGTLTPRAERLLGEIGQMTAHLWSALERAWSARRADPLATVRTETDRIADVRSSLAGELASGALPLAAAIDVAIVSRTFDRMAHHAGTAAERIGPLVATPSASAP